MTTPGFCDTCGKSTFTLYGGAHKCPPMFTVTNEDGECERTVYAYDHEAAAEEWAERYDCESNEYGILRGSECTAIVTDSEGVTKRFALFGESVPSYSATEVE